MRCCSAFSGAYTPINVLNVKLRRNKRRQSLKSGNIKRNTSISFISMKFNTRTSTRLPLPETTARAHSRLLACAIEAALDASNTCEVMEFGAGSGLLAAQLLDALGAQCARYTIVELS